MQNIGKTGIPKECESRRYTPLVIGVYLLLNGFGLQ